MKLIELIRNFFHRLFYGKSKEKTPQVDDGTHASGTTNDDPPSVPTIELESTTGTQAPQSGNTSQPANNNYGEIPQHPKMSKNYTVQIVPFLTSILKLNYEATYKVLYSISNSVDARFPIIRVPQRGCEIKLPVLGRSGKRGVCEERLCKIIKDLKLHGFYDSLSLFIGNYSKPFEPDIAYIDTQKGIFVDIEIDEPYSGWERKPIHYKTENGTIDDLRNHYFTERGWTVIRFSEKQVHKHPKSCLKRVYQLLNKMDVTITMPQSLATEADISLEDMWTKKQAESMEQNDEREKMLGIDKFIQPVEGPHIILKDYLKGRELEKKISNREEAQRKVSEQIQSRFLESPPQPPIVSNANSDDQKRKEAEQYEHQQYISTQSKPKTTPSSRGYA